VLDPPGQIQAPQPPPSEQSNDADSEVEHQPGADAVHGAEVPPAAQDGAAQRRWVTRGSWSHIFPIRPAAAKPAAASTAPVVDITAAVRQQLDSAAPTRTPAPTAASAAANQKEGVKRKVQCWGATEELKTQLAQAVVELQQRRAGGLAPKFREVAAKHNVPQTTLASYSKRCDQSASPGEHILADACT